MTISEILSTYGPQINAASAKYGVPASLIASQIQAESSGNPNAFNPKDNSAGLLQLEPGTASDMGITDPFDPAQSIDGGARYLAQQFARFGNWPEALAAYNQGPTSYVNNGAFPGAVNYATKILNAVGLGPSPGFQWPTRRPKTRRPLTPGAG